MLKLSRERNMERYQKYLEAMARLAEVTKEQSVDLKEVTDLDWTEAGAIIPDLLESVSG